MTDSLTPQESREIFNRLGSLDAKTEANGEAIRSLAEAEKDRGDRLERLVDRHDKILLGNNGTPGLKVELDRLARSYAFYSWMTRGALMAGITAIVGMVVGRFF